MPVAVYRGREASTTHTVSCTVAFYDNVMSLMSRSNTNLYLSLQASRYLQTPGDSCEIKPKSHNVVKWNESKNKRCGMSYVQNSLY